MSRRVFKAETEKIKTNSHKCITSVDVNMQGSHISHESIQICNKSNKHNEEDLNED